MTLKQTLEDHIVFVVSVAAITAFVAGWGACETVRVTSKSEKIADLERQYSDLSKQAKDGALAVEPYQKQITELLSNTKRLETEVASARRLEAELSSTQGNLAQWQQALQSLKAANVQLQSDLNRCTTNATVVGLVRAMEGKKESLEKDLAFETQWHAESPRGEEYKRRIGEYQVRLMSLQEKLICTRQ